MFLKSIQKHKQQNTSSVSFSFDYFHYLFSFNHRDPYVFIISTNPPQIKMHFSTLLLTLLPVLALAAPSTTPLKRQNSPPTLDDINNAQLAWLQDTGAVSSFLDYAVSLFPGSPSDLLYQAWIALAAEKDELTHKAVLDSVFVFGDNADPNVLAAYQVLVNDGTFQSVVDLLQDMANTGNLADVQLINSNRCANVLPAIDTYFAAAAHVTGGVAYPAIRPLACQ
jgi:hypothetical protein